MVDKKRIIHLILEEILWYCPSKKHFEGFLMFLL